MDTTSPQVGPGTMAGPVLTDERALERLFRARFTPLTEEARGQLEDSAAAAPRVVDAAFRHAWEERQRFQTEPELDAFLHDAVFHAAARERSRHASIHRFERGGSGAAAARPAAHAAPPADVDQAWLHLARGLGLLPPEEVSAESVAQARHEHAEHVKSIAKRPSWAIPLVVGGIAIAATLGVAWYLNRLGDEGQIMRALGSPEAHTHASAAAQAAKITLDDGTTATLAPESKLIVPKGFGDKMRVVRLEGAATLAVAPGQKTPFQLRAGDAVIVATGTLFAVRAYPTDDAVTVLVKEGSVTVRRRLAPADSTRTLAAGHALRLENKSGALREPSAVQLASATGWLDNRLTIDGAELRDVVPQLHRWYGTDIKVPDLPLLDRKVSMEVSLDSLGQAIAAVEKSAGVRFGYEGTTMVFRDPAKRK